MQEKSSLSKIIHNYMYVLPFWRRPSVSPRVSKNSGQPRNLTGEKQRQLEALCNKLFERQDLVMSGKLQLLGLGKVKQRMGSKRWPGLQCVIYTICEDTIKKYISGDDFFIRYRDESYMLVFASASPKESELRASLIAEEIKRRLFEEEGIEDIAVISQTTKISAATMGRQFSMTEELDVAFDDGSDFTVDEPSPVRGTASPKILEIEAYSNFRESDVALDLGVRIKELPYHAVQYIPVWDQVRGRLIAHLCLAKGNGVFDDPVEEHRALYSSVSPAERARMDLALLARNIKWMRDNPEKLSGFGIICPVRYETLVGIESKKDYRALCQKIDERTKQFLLFMVLDIPPSIPWLSLGEAVSPLKTYGRVLCGQMSQFENADFEAMRLAGFDNVGIILSGSAPVKRVDIESFTMKAKRHLINKTFVLGIDNPRTGAEAAAAGVNFMAGQAIHAAIPSPETKPSFGGHSYGMIWRNSYSA